MKKQDDRGRDGGTNFILRIKEQETCLTLQEHDDDDNVRFRFQIVLNWNLILNKQISFLKSSKKLKLPHIGQNNYKTSVKLSLFPVSVIYFHTFLKLILLNCAVFTQQTNNGCKLLQLVN